LHCGGAYFSLDRRHKHETLHSFFPQSPAVEKEELKKNTRKKTLQYVIISALVIYFLSRLAMVLRLRTVKKIAENMERIFGSHKWTKSVAPFIFRNPNAM